MTNVWCFTGHIGQDAEKRFTANQKAVVSFSVPCKSGFGDNAKTDWVDCTIWGKQAEGRLVEYLKKGTPVCVTGEASIRTWDKPDGTIGFKLSCTVRDIELMGGRSQNSDGGSQGGDTGASEGGELDDEIPF